MLDEIAERQHGILTATQARAAGVTDSAIKARVRSGRWQRVFLGVFAVFSGPLPRLSLLWAVVLRAGPGAVLSHETAAEVAGLLKGPGEMIHVTVPSGRDPAGIPGVVVHRSGHVAMRMHPSRTPPQTRLEETIVDLTQVARTIGDAQSWLAQAIGSRLTTSERLACAMRRRSRVRWRSELMAALVDVAAGAHSWLELAYLRDVERAHGLPVAARQQASGRRVRRYDDVRYPDYRLRVELDGRAAHPDRRRWRDMSRDNDAVVAGDRVLRYGFADVAGDPCAVARQVASVLRNSGWSGHPMCCPRVGCSSWSD